MTRAFSVRGAAAVTGLALLVAGCGSSNSSPSSAQPGSPASGGQAANGSLTIGTAKGSVGTHLTGARGRAIYLWSADKNGTSSCSSACAKVWPPVMALSTPGVSGSAVAADVGAVGRAGGGRQVTYKGHPLYYFSGDPSAGTTNGEGSKAFGAKWWLVSPSGSGLTHTSSSSAGGSVPLYGGGASSYGGGAASNPY
jgi:predicted lipoprotein with Yx(FWY)xxD motif